MAAGRQGWLQAKAGVAVSALVVAAVGLLCSSAAAAEPPEYLRSFGSDGSPSTGFEKAGSVAVDQQTHFVYVIDG